MPRPPYGHSIDNLPEGECDQIRALHAASHGRNEIARRLGRSGRTITVVAHGMGLTFARTDTEAATKARMADLAEKRTILAEALTDDALRLTEQLWQPAKVFNIGGKDNKYTEKDVDQPPADAKKNLVAAAGMAIDRSLRLVPATADDGTDAARSMVGQLLTGLQTIAREEYAESAASGVDIMLTLVYALLALAVLIALLGIANTLTLAVHERTRELGLLRAVGQTRTQLRAMVRWESVLVAAFGTAGGLGLGAFLGWALVKASDAAGTSALRCRPAGSRSSCWSGWPPGSWPDGVRPGAPRAWTY